MIRTAIKTTILFFILLFSGHIASAQAQSINGGWLADNGDLIFLVKSTKNKVIALDISAAKQLRYVLTGEMVGDQLTLATKDGATTLTATVAGESFTGMLSPAAAEPQDLNANLYFAYNGSSYDGVWKTDGADSYLLYATLKLKGVVTTITASFAMSGNQTLSYNVFLGTPAAADNNGDMGYAGVSLLDYSVLKLAFPSTTTANATLSKGKTNTKSTLAKTIAVTKKSGEF